jgi:hypothetical protein
MKNAEEGAGEFVHIFGKEFEPQDAGRRLLEVLCMPGGMEAFVQGYNGRLLFVPMKVSDGTGEHTGFSVYSSMTPNRGQWGNVEETMYWYDTTTVTRTECLPMTLSEDIGKGVRTAYLAALNRRPSKE